MRGLIAVAIATAPNATHAAAANPSLIYMHHSYQDARHKPDRAIGAAGRSHAAERLEEAPKPAPVGTHSKIPPLHAGFPEPIKF